MSPGSQLIEAETVEPSTGARIRAFDGKDVGRLVNMSDGVLRIRKGGACYSVPDILVRAAGEDSVVLHVDAKTLQGYLRPEGGLEPPRRLRTMLRAPAGVLGGFVGGCALVLAVSVGLTEGAADADRMASERFAQQRIIPERIEVRPGVSIATGIARSSVRHSGAEMSSLAAPVMRELTP